MNRRLVPPAFPATGAVCVLLGLALSPSPARAQDPCTALHPGLQTGPLPLSFFEGGLGRARRVCPRTEISLLGSVAGIDVADDLVFEDGNFYATLAGSAEVAGSWRFSERGELFASIQAVQYRLVQNATLIRERLGFGFSSLGATWQTWRRRRIALAFTGRVRLPTAAGYHEHSWPLAADLGLALAWRPHRAWAVHGQLGGVVTAVAGRGHHATRAGLQLLAGVEYTPWHWLGLVLDLATLMGYDTSLDRATIGIGLRFRVWEKLGIEVAALLPWAGSQAVDLAAGLRLSWRMGT